MGARPSSLAGCAYRPKVLNLSNPHDAGGRHEAAGGALDHRGAGIWPLREFYAEAFGWTITDGPHLSLVQQENAAPVMASCWHRARPRSM